MARRNPDSADHPHPAIAIAVALENPPQAAGDFLRHHPILVLQETRVTMTEPPKRHWTTHVGQAAGHPAAFVVVILYAVLWLTFSRATFEWNAVATLAVFVMTLFIQRANRRDNLALHAKLDELLRVESGARSELAQLDEQEPEAIERHRDAEVRKTGADASTAA
jgi:low affinity Fe/Cu permease